MFEGRAWVRSHKYYLSQDSKNETENMHMRFAQHYIVSASGLKKPTYMRFVHTDEIVYGSPWYLPKISWLREQSHRYTSTEIALYQHLLFQHGLHISSHGAWADLETVPVRTALVPIPCQVFCAQPTTSVEFQQFLAAPSAANQHPKGDLTPVGWKLRRHVQWEEERK